MATIKIVDLRPVGSEFFADSESYLNELTDDELNLTQGGSTLVCSVVTITIVSLISMTATTGLSRPLAS
jgi:hypothetical protein